MRTSLVVAAALPAATFGLLGGLHVADRTATYATQQYNGLSDALLFVAGSVLVFLGVGVSLQVLTSIEERGIRFWGPRRGWRITPAIARTIVAHASIGWVLGSILMVAGHLLGLFLAQFPHRHNLGIFRGPMQLAPISLPILGFLAGMLTFEVLVYIGMSRMKFANREKPDPSALEARRPLR